MSAGEWFRKKTWSTSDQEYFFAHLKRSRGLFNKAQHLRIRDRELQSVGNEDLFRAAVELPGKLFVEYPDESQFAQAHSRQADCSKKLRQCDPALAAYPVAMDVQRLQPRWAPSAYPSLAWLVAAGPFPLFCNEAIAALDEFGKGESFPVEEYESGASRALIHAAKNSPESERPWALKALDAASRERSGFRYHSRLGSVHNPDAMVCEKLKRLAA